MRKYHLISKRGEGTFSEVIKAQNTKTGNFYAIKCMKSTYKSAEQVNNLREIQAIKRLSPHPNIVKLEEVLFDPPTGRLALVFELMEGNVYELMKDREEHFNDVLVKSFMLQIFSALDHMHGKGVFHRDVKPENILVDKTGKHLKLADFGSCRGVQGKPPFTEYISTRWYRPPECLLTCGMYGPEMDIWGAGCILFELTTLYPLFPGADEIDQINRIHRVLGTPSSTVLSKLMKYASTQTNFSFLPQQGIGLSKLLPEAKDSCLDLLTRSVAYDATKRITSSTAVVHPYFVGVQSHVKENSHPDLFARSSSFASIPKSSFGTTSLEEDQIENKPVTKTRSMVSILLARSDKKEFIKEAKERNITFYRRKNEAGHQKTMGLVNEKTTRGSLPKLKSLLPDTKRNESKPSNPPREQKPRLRQPRKYAHLQSSGYGGIGSASMQRKAAFTSLRKSKPNERKLPPIREPHEKQRYQSRMKAYDMC
eukprot:CCRYP_015639-RD/>CCRYP_015639-RD protein AED:0.06 eAED:0.06 QI:2627/1/1/1/0.85/0.62/8/318/480